MATAYKVLGTSNPAATTATTLYTVPASTSTIVSTINICNQAASNGTFRIAIRPAGATLANNHYLVYDTLIPSNDSISLTMGITLGTTDIITVYANSTTMSFIAFGTEIT
jgi:glucose-6-phosphate dehydrogenase assembly protein OpcA